MTLEKVDWLFNKSWMGKFIHSQGGLKFRIPVTVGLLFLFLDVSGAQEPLPSQTSPPSASRPYITQDGLTLEKLIESANSRRADLLAARQRILIAQGRLTQSALRPNPALETEYGSPRFLGGEPESDFSVGLSQTFELGGKRGRRVAVARLEVEQVRADILLIERQIAADIRRNYAKAVAAARQLDVIEKLLAADAELVRVTEARLGEGDVAPLDLSLVKVESDRLRIQQIQARADLETTILELRTLTGFDVSEPFTISPQADRPPRLELTLSELTENAMRDRTDLRAAIIGEKIGSAKVSLARSQSVPNIAASVRFSRTNGIIDLPPTAGGGVATDLGNALTFGVSFEIPVFNRNQGEIAAATGERLRAEKQREFLETTIKRDVAIAFRQYRAAAEKLVIYSTQILPRAEANLQTVRAAYGLGEFSVFEVVAEQRRLNENVSGYNQVLLEYYTALAALEAAVGSPLTDSAFAPGSSSVLPDTKTVPKQFNRDEFLRSINRDKIERISLLKSTDSKEQREKK